MFYLAKFFQLSAMLIVGGGFLANFPKLMSPKFLLIGLLFFACGWVIERFLLKK